MDERGITHNIATASDGLIASTDSEDQPLAKLKTKLKPKSKPLVSDSYTEMYH